jgi:curved DNA-binding protein CbpA
MASLVPPTVVPLLRKDADIRRLALGPREGFLLSQIDGATTAEDLAQITRLSASEVSAMLHALEAAGVVELPHRKENASVRAPSAPSRRSAKPSIASRPSKPSRSPKQQEKPSQPRPRSTAVVPESALGEEDRRQILEMAARLEGADHYAALGVERDADVKTIKRAYHALAMRFHPDRFFRKQLGELKQTVERVFARITRAHDTLSKKALREAYDAALPPPPAKPRTGEMRPPTRRSVRAQRAAPAPMPAAGRAPPPVAADPLRRIVAANRRRQIQGHVDVFLGAAREALARGDLVAAVHHYRLAAQCTRDPAVHAALAEIDAKARAHSWSTNLEKARSAERAGRWDEAGAAYARAYGAQPEPWMAERAANALRLAKGDLRHAAQLAEQAVLAEPLNAEFRVTLAEVYLDAGLLARAAGESGRAAAIAPNEARVRALAKLVASRKR